jgi:hypoxanthine phosphoribosyltransferase
LNLSEKKENLETHKFELLYSQDKIGRRIKQLGKQISRDYAGKNPILIGVLKGCLIFLADLVRQISEPIEIDFVDASSYNGGEIRDDEVIFSREPEKALTGRHILLVEGVVDSGHTALEITRLIKLQEPASIEIVTLLDKSKCRKIPVEIKYRGFEAEDYFVIGYGLDQDQKYRNLPFIGRVLNGE